MDQYLIKGAVGTVLFSSFLLTHELVHSFVSRSKVIRIEGDYALFIFGGMARNSRDASSPSDKFFITVAGLLASFFLTTAFYGLGAVGGSLGPGGYSQSWSQSIWALSIWHLQSSTSLPTSCSTEGSFCGQPLGV